MNESNVNIFIFRPFIFRIEITVSNTITPSITEYSAINDTTEFLSVDHIVQNILIIVANKIANKNFPISEDNL